MDPRLRRLAADHRKLLALCRDGSPISLVETEGEPPERYVLQFNVLGLVGDDEKSLQPGSSHRAEVFLTRDYPRRPPFCRMLTPVFHPNIDPQKICIGDHWSAGQSLPQLVVRIGEMIAYQSYNVKSPLNAQAAAWAEQNVARLPLDKTDISAGLT